MTTFERRARVDAAGNVTVPVGAEEAGTEVIVSVRPAEWVTPSKEHWLAELDALAGSVDDPSFDRPEQPPVEQRQPLD